MKRCPLWVKSRQVQRKSRCLLSGHQPYLRRRVGSIIVVGNINKFVPE